MSGRDPRTPDATGTGAPDAESAFERNLRVLLGRCYVAARCEPAFRVRARAACLAAVDSSHTGPRQAAARPVSSRRAGSRVLRAWRPALAAAALLLVSLTALWWILDDGAGDTRRDAILARGEVAVRFGPGSRWQSLGAAPDEDPESPDVARLNLDDGHGVQVEALTPPGLALAISGLGPAGSGAWLEAQASARWVAAPAPRVTLDAGALSLTHEDGGVAWLLQTTHGTLALSAGSLSARVLGADGVALLLAPLFDATGEQPPRATLLSPAGALPLPAGRALRLRNGVLTDASTMGTDSTAARAPEFDAPQFERRPEPLSPAVEAGDGSEAASPTAAALPEPGVLQGRVQRAGAPVTAFRVVLAPQEVPPRAEPEAREFRAVDGAFRWADIEPGLYAVFVQSAEAPAWIRRDLVVTDAASLPMLDVVLETDSAAASGFVVDAATGAPIEGATILSETDAPTRLLAIDNSMLPSELTARTGSDLAGAFLLDTLSPGEQLLRVTAPGYAPAWSGPLSTEPAAVIEGLLFRLQPGASVHGRVIGEDGLPWSAAVVIASPQISGMHPCLTFAYALTDADGRYVLPDLPPGDGIVLLIGDDSAGVTGFAPRVLPWQLSPGESLTLDFLLGAEVGGEHASAPAPSAAIGTAAAGATGSPGADAPAAEAGCRMSGVLFDAMGAPIAGQMLSIISADAPADEAQNRWRGVVTGSDGGYSFTGVAAGDWEVFVGSADGHGVSRVGSVNVPAAAEFVHDVRLSGALIAGRIVRAVDGAPVEHGLVILMRRDDGTSTWDFQGRLVANSSGGFRFEHLRPGRYRVSAWDLDGSLGAETGGELLLEAAGALDGVELALAPGGGLLVRVRDGRGLPVAGARVTFTNAAGEEQQFGLSTSTDAEGLLPAPGMRPGLWFVAVRPPVAEAGATRLQARELSVDVRAGPGQELQFTLADAP